MARQHSAVNVDDDDHDDQHHHNDHHPNHLIDPSPEEEKRILRRKLISLSGSVIVALSAGSNYAFSSFAPQLQEALHLTSTQINLIGIAGNAGVYLSSPLWGRFIDKRGPSIAMLTGAIMVPLGYGGLSYAYRRKSVDTPTTLLVLLNLLTGLGNSGSFTAAMNAQAKSWGGSRRGTATALVLSGFGLSAFFYSTLSHALFADNTSDYLLLLAFGSMASMLIGLAIVKPLPIVEHHHHHHHDRRRESYGGDGEERATGSRRSSGGALGPPHGYTRRRTSSEIGARTAIWDETPSIDSGCSDDECDDRVGPSGSSADGRNDRLRPRADDDLRHHDESDNEGAAPISERQSLLPGRPEAKAIQAEEAPAGQIDISGKKLFKQIDFLLLFCVMALVSGAGLLLINNVGTITKTLWDYNHRDTPELLSGRSDGLLHPEAMVAATTAEYLEALKMSAKASVQKLQAQQVSAISLCNASGRIIIGLLSDFLVNRTGSASQRVWLLIVVTTLAFLSQLLAALPRTIQTVHQLLGVSVLTGLSYGTLFGLCPVLMFEWFGMKHFSQNYGFLSLSPVIAGNIFNLLFGRIYDSHVPSASVGGGSGNGAPGALDVRAVLDGGLWLQVREVLQATTAAGDGAHHFCLDGPECYRKVFVVTTLGSVIAVAASVVLIARRAGGDGGLARMLRGGEA
ncbi:uncharacterized protein PFL1_00395 [Pseudozyma flocculosa PF-1]|uniref:Uncharacterized protein n=1 Tax=Pseudozyma flocculosa TaxID=84751 RepID=A0A5C3ERK7_9BASI|nr:uncharacterized protein PFL1_00395 [Pseudozyma flocculosa PF-1]EPQ32198.1 hypothetical protein PFL1_00395 [Pseudozyma flocculosa PF-1]SPO34858.1 uncharacterized protein PSFLO_00329 [Pseudozyma flocculosa]